MRKPKPTLYNLPTKPTKDTSARDLAVYIKSLEKACKGRWVTFLHPILGKVPGRCLKATHTGFAEPGHLIEFTLTIEGRAKSTRNTIEVSMIETYAQFHDTKQEAVDSCTDNG